MEYIEWTLDKINKYLEEKEIERGVDPKELLQLSKFVREHKFKSMFDLGTFLGVSGYIIGTSSPDGDTLVSSDIGRIEQSKYGKIHKWDYDTYGMHLPKDAIYVEGDFRDIMDDLLKKHNPEFAFLDDGHTPRAVFEQIFLCHMNKIKYIAVHDTNLRKVRRAIKAAVFKGMYKIILDDTTSCPEKGITFLELVE